MGVRIPYNVPASSTQIERVNLYESTSECGPYNLVHYEVIGTGSGEIVYPDGNPSRWYRISFVDELGVEGVKSIPTHGEYASLTGQALNRISARIGQTVMLNASFYRNGILTDPYAIRLIRIYRQSTEDVNLVAEIPAPNPGASDYPDPILHDDSRPGYYQLPFLVPDDFISPAIYFDVWHFVSDDPGTADIDDESIWNSKCNRFWVYPDGWYVDDELYSPQLGFEPLNANFRAGEVRPMEIGMMPLPIYDYDYNLITTLIPMLDAKISIQTRNNEVIVDDESMTIGLRQGSYRTNPFVFRYTLDTSLFLIGTYDYHIKVHMPNGSIVKSPKFTFTIA